MLNMKKPSRVIIVAVVALAVFVSVGFAVNWAVTATREPTVAPGIISDGINAADVVLDAALDWIKGDYDGYRDVGLAVQRENGAVFDNWRLEYIEHVHTDEGIGIDVYRFGWRVHTTTPDRVILAGGMELDADGWLLDTYPNSWYLLFENSWDELKFVTAMMANDCSPGDELFTIDMIRMLEIQR